MQRAWASSKIDLYFEDLENDQLVRRGFNNTIQNPSDEQITAFTNAVDGLTELSSAHTVLVESYQYSH